MRYEDMHPIELHYCGVKMLKAQEDLGILRQAHIEYLLGDLDGGQHGRVVDEYDVIRFGVKYLIVVIMVVIKVIKVVIKVVIRVIKVIVNLMAIEHELF